MQFAVWPSYERPWDEVLTLARWAESAGFGGFWAADHFLQFGAADDDRGDGEVQECWTVLTAVGAAVPRLRLVSMVSPVTFHHPVVLTKRAVTADHVSGGRVVLGVGAGWQVNEHLAYGVELPAPGPRVDRFGEALQVIHGMLREDRFSFGGSYFQVDDVACRPKPVGALPILVGSKGPRMARLTARWADEWNTWGDPTQLAERSALVEQACDSVGRDPATLTRSAQAVIVLLDDEADRAAAEAKAMPGQTLIGTAGQLVELLQQYVAMGVHEFAVPDFNLGRTGAERLEQYQRLHAEVLVHVG